MKRTVLIGIGLFLAITFSATAQNVWSIGIEQSTRSDWQAASDTLEGASGASITFRSYAQNSIAQQVVYQAWTRSGTLQFAMIPDSWAYSLMRYVEDLSDVVDDLQAAGINPTTVNGTPLGVPIPFADGWFLAVLDWPDDRDAAIALLVAVSGGRSTDTTSAASAATASVSISSLRTEKIDRSAHNPRIDGALETLLVAAQAVASSAVTELMTALPTSASTAIATLAELFNIPYTSSTSSVTIVLESQPGRSTTSNVAALSAIGISTSSIEYSSDLIKVSVPLSMLDDVAARLSGVLYIRAPYVPYPLGTASEGSSLIGAAAFHSAGIEGSGVKVAIIDLGFSGMTQAQARGDLPLALQQHDLTSTGMTSGLSHGTAVAEIIYDIAPEAELHLIKIADEVDLDLAVTYCLTNGIDIINHSLGWYNTNFYDGTGTVAEIAQRAIDGGILWVNAAGNEAENHWEGIYSDGNSDGWHDQTITLAAGGGSSITLYLTWNEWPQASTDYDLYLYDPNGTLLASSTKHQTGTEEPTESIQVTANQAGTYSVQIKGFGGRRLELFSLYQALSPAVASSCVLAPGNVEDVVTVGAIDHSLYTTGPQEPYSSQGPTNDGRSKPDLVAPDNVTTGTVPYTTFAGTSGAAPHASAAAALLLCHQPTLNGAALRSLLLANAIPMGSTNVYGQGRLSLQPPTGSNQSPTAAFTWSPSAPQVGVTVTFNGTGSSDSDGWVASYAWDYGDGSTGTGSITTHSYAAPGVYSVQLTVTDNDGATATRTQQITVSASANNPPTASFTWSPSAPQAGFTVTFNGTGSSDSDGWVASYAWDYGDGSTGTGSIATHSYAAPGVYSVQLTVTDNNGATATRTQQITVSASANNPPIAAFTTSPNPTQPNVWMSFNAAGSYDIDGSIVQYAWSFGDGSTGSGSLAYHRYASAGSYTARLTVTDDDGATNSDELTVVIQSTAAPDLTVQNLSYSPTSPTQGQSVAFSITVYNAGNAAAGTFRVRLQGSGSATATYISQLAAGASQTIALTRTLSASTETFTVTVDDLGQVNESNETNNTQSVTIVASTPAPTANAGGPYSATAGQAIAFNGTASGGQITSYVWTFGDGASATGSTPSHTYASAGTYTVYLTVYGPGGQSTASTQAVITQAQPALTAQVSLPKSSYEIGEHIAITFVTNRTAYVYLCEVTPDNRVLLVYPNLFESNNSVAAGTHTVPGGGYTISVSEPAGTETLYLFAATSRLSAFPTSFGFSFPVLSTNPSTFRDSVLHEMQSTLSAGNWAFDTLSYNVVAPAPTTGTVRVESTPSGATARLDGSTIGTTTVEQAGLSPGVHTVQVSKTGYQSATTQVTIVAGQTSTVHLTLTALPVNDSPVAVFTSTPGQPIAGQGVQFDASGSYDPDGSISSYSWAFGDGTTASGAAPNHAYATTGTFAVTLTVTDNEGGTGSVTHNVTVVTASEVGWVSPVSHDDPADNWIRGEWAYDDDTSRSGKYNLPGLEWSSWLILNAPEGGLSCDRIRLRVSDNISSQHIHRWQYEVYRDEEWIAVYDGTPPEKEWFEVAFDVGTVTKMRVRAYNTWGGMWRAEVWEADFHDATTTP